MPVYPCSGIADCRSMSQICLSGRRQANGVQVPESRFPLWVAAAWGGGRLAGFLIEYAACADDPQYDPVME